MSKPTNEVFAHFGAKLAYDRARTTFWCKVQSRPRPRPRQDDDRTTNTNILDDDDGKRDDEPPQPCQQPPRWFLFCLAPNPRPQDALTDRKNIRILECSLPEWSLLDCCRPECNRPDFLLFVLCLYVCAGLNQKSMNAFEHAKSYKAPASLSACKKNNRRKGERRVAVNGCHSNAHAMNRL